MQGFVRNPQTGWRKIGQETIVLDFKNKRLVGLNDSAGWMWSQLAKPRTASWFTAYFSNADLPETQHAIVAFLTSMEAQSLLLSGQKVTDQTHTEDDSLLPLSQPPQVLWQEPLQQVAGTCALVSGQSPLCNQAPFS